MLHTLHWHMSLKSPEAQAQLDELRGDALRLFLQLACVGYAMWHLAYTSLLPASDSIFRAYAIFAVAVPFLVLAYVLIERNRIASAGCFVGGGLASILWSLYVLRSARGAILCVMLVLIASFVIHPLGGVLVGALSVGLLGILGAILPGLVTLEDIGYVATFAGLVVVGVWALTVHLFLALNWYEESYARAEQQTREAQGHRGQLVDAWKQLDTAYYRLERTNAALRLAWKTADEAERSKMELVTNISHELRTPLNLIVGYSEMMMTSPGSYGSAVLPAPYRLDLNAVYRSAQHLLALTDDVLDLARLEVGRLGLLREPVDLAQVVRDAIALVQDYVEAKGLALRLVVSGEIPPLLLDRLRIRQVLLNLLTNAARWTEHGFVEVKMVRSERQVRVTVTDTGPGIDPSVASGIFERFVTSSSPSSEGHTGTGLGLPISRTFVELHGGEIGVESALGSGTTFWFTLPLQPIGGTGSAPFTETLVPEYLRQPERVLILANADSGVIRLFQRHADGFRVERASDLADARLRAVDLKATAIVADIDTPDCPDSSSVPIVRCPLPQTGSVAAGLGVADYLVKPISQDTLIGAVARLGRPVRRILIADDDVWFVQLLTRMLTSRDSPYTIASAHNGEDALHKMRGDPPDLLILDLAMPGLGGIGVIRELKEDSGLSDVSVIVISAQGETEVEVPLGGDLRINKPEGFRLGELTRVIVAAVNQLTPVHAYVERTEPVPRVAPPG